MNGKRLEEVNTFKYLGAIINKDGSSIKEIKSRLALALAAMTKLAKLWKSHNIKPGTKVRLFKTLVSPIALYGCEAWILTAEIMRRIQAFEMKCIRKILNITYHISRTEN